MSSRPFPIRLFIFFAFLSLYPGCRNTKGDDEDSERTSPAAVVAVRVAPVIERTADVTVEAFGKTAAERSEKVLSPIAGRIVSLNILNGTPVKRGDILAVLETKEAEAAVLGAEAMLRSATTPGEKAEAERMLRLARSTRNNVQVAATADGVVSGRVVSEGELVAEGAELFTIIDLSTLVFQADVALRDIPLLRRGQRAVVAFPSDPGKRFSAAVEAINPQTDAASQTVRVRIAFSGRKNISGEFLRTEMAGTARIIVGRRPHARFVPRSALLRNDENDSYSVVTVSPDSLSRILPVTVGVVEDSTAEIQGADIHSGMDVIAEGNYALADSTRVTVSGQDRP